MRDSRERANHTIVLLSGGLDSSLAVKEMIDQGIGVTAVHFTSPFYNCPSRKGGCKNQAVKITNEFGVPIRVIHKGMDYMRIVQNPPHEHGRGMNPRFHWRIYMLEKIFFPFLTHKSMQFPNRTMLPLHRKKGWSLYGAGTECS